MENFTSSSARVSLRNRFSVKFIGLLLLFVVMSVSEGWGQLLLTEDFTGYTTSTNLAGQGSWTKGGSGPDATVSNTTPLTYAGYNGGDGEYIVMPTSTNTASRVYKSFTSTTAIGNTFYVSFLLRIATTTTTGDYFISLGDPGTNSVYAPRLFAKTSGAGYKLGISKAQNVASANFGTTVLSLNTTYLIVMRFSGVSGSNNDLTYLWINPSLSVEPITTNSECNDISTADPGFNSGNIGNFHWHNRTASNNPTGYFDGIRIACGATSASAWTSLSAQSTSPTIFTSGTLSAVGTTYGTASTSPTTFTVSGSNLTADIAISAPSGYEISQTSGGASGYATSQTLTQSGGSVASKTIYVRLAATTTAGNYSGNVQLTSTGATTVNVATISSTVSPKALTMSGLSVPASKVYDGSTSAVVTDAKTLQSTETIGTGTTSDGKPFTGDDVSITGTAVGTYNNKNVASATSVTFSGLSLTGAQAANYTLTTQSAASATITAKALTMSGLSVPASKTYDGGTTAVVTDSKALQSAEAVGAGNTGDGKPYTGDVVSITGTAVGTYNSKDVATASTVTYSGLSLTGAQAGNYSLTVQSPSSVTITPKNLTISGLTANNKNVDGNTTAILSGTPSLVGVVLADASNVSISGTPTAEFSQSTVGIGLPVTVSGYTLSGSAAGNYSLTQPTGLTADITSATITGAATATAFTTIYGTPSSAQSFTVSGSGLSDDITATAPTGFEVSSDNTTFGSTATLTNSGGSASGNIYVRLTANALVSGSYNSNNIVLTSTGASVVNITTAASGNTVTAKALTMSGLSVPASKVYDRLTTAVVTDSKTLQSSETFGTGTSSDGKPYTGDDVSITGTVVGTYNSKDVATAATVTFTGLSLTGTAAGNYTLTIQTPAAATITPKELTVTGASVTSKSYTGTNVATITGATLTGVISPDVTTLVAGSNTFNSVNVANGISVTTNYNLTGADNGNYNLTQPTLTGNITTASLTITGLTGTNKVYDATLTASFTGTPAYVGLQNGETFTVTGTPSATYATKTKANSKAITVTGFTAPTTNYTVTQPTGLTANITAATLTVSGASATSKTYDGTNTATTTGGSFVGILLSDAVTLTHNAGTFAQSNAGTNLSVTSNITATGTDGANYTVTQPTLTADINIADQTISGLAETDNKTTATNTYSLSGVSASSGLTVSFTSSDESVATISGTTVTIVGPGITTITATQTGNGNYNAATSVNQTLTVTRATAVSDYFRTKATGNWSDVGTWESSYNNIDWISATATPTSSSSTITILNGHTVSVAAAVTVDQLMISSGGILEGNTNLTVNDGSGDDIVIQNGGILKYSTSSSYAAFGSGSPTISNETGGVILVTAGSIIQNLQNSNYVYKNASTLEWNSVNAFSFTGVTYFPNADASTIPILRISNTIGGTVGGGTSGIVNGVLEVNGSVTFGGNSTKTFRNGIRGSGTVTQTTAYQFIISGSSAEIGGGTLTLLSGGGLTINSGSVATLSSNKTINTGPITINGTIDFGTYVLSGTSAFTLASGATLKTANALGLSGSITISGTKTFNAAANYIFNGSSAQALNTINTANSLEISNSAGVNLDVNLTLSNLSINNSSILNINAGKQLTVNTSLTNNGTLNLLSSGLTSTAAIIPPSTISGSGSANIQQYLTTGRNWYISSPISRGTLPYSGYEYVESTPAWNPLSAGTEMTVGKGYIVQPSVSGSVIFSGAINTNEPTLTLYRTTGKTKEGFNLVGNPYPSYLNWNSLSKTNLMGTMWYRTKEASAYRFYTYNGTSAGYGDTGVGSPAGVTNLIPPMQAFWVRVEGAASGTLGFTRNARAHQDGAGNTIKAPKTSPNKIIRLQVSNNVHTDETVLYFNDNASDNFDAFDSQKLMSNDASVPEIYTLAGTEQLVINGMNSLPLNTELPLGFVTGESNTFSLAATEISHLPSDVRVVLKDGSLEYDLTDGGTYSFSSPIASTSSRFSVIFKSAGTVTDVQNPSANDKNLLVYCNANKHIVVESNSTAVVSVYNAVGQKLFTQNLLSDKTELKHTFTPGVYMVTVNGVNRKVVVE